MKEKRTRILSILVKPINGKALTDPLPVFDRILREIKGSTKLGQEEACFALCNQFKELFPEAQWQREHLFWTKHNHFHNLLVTSCAKALYELKNIRYEHVQSNNQGSGQSAHSEYNADDR